MGALPSKLKVRVEQDVQNDQAGDGNRISDQGLRSHVLTLLSELSGLSVHGG